MTIEKTIADMRKMTMDAAVKEAELHAHLGLSKCERKREKGSLGVSIRNDKLTALLDYVERLEAERVEQNDQIVRLRNELARYKEREATMGWNQR